MKRNGNAILAWISAAAFAFATAWAQFADTPIGFAGLREFGPPALAWSVVLVTALMALFLSLPRLHTRARLVACSAFSFLLFMVVAFFTSPVAAMLLAFISGNLFRETRLAVQ